MKQTNLDARVFCQDCPVRTCCTLPNCPTVGQAREWGRRKRAQSGDGCALAVIGVLLAAVVIFMAARLFVERVHLMQFGGF